MKERPAWIHVQLIMHRLMAMFNALNGLFFYFEKRIKVFIFRVPAIKWLPSQCFDECTTV